MRRQRAVRRAAPRAHPSRRLGLSDPQARAGARAPHGPCGARGRRLSRPRHRLAPHQGEEMTATVLGIADDRALGSSLRVIVTQPESLRAAKAAVDEVVAAIDAAASRFRADSELSLVNARPDLVTRVSPLLARMIAAALRGAKLTDGAVDPTVGSAVRLSGYDTDFDSVAKSGGELRVVVEHVPGWQAVR